MRILLSRTDSIGDVVLTLPVAAVLKQEFPGCTVIFLGREYTRPVVERCGFVDEFYPLPARPQQEEGLLASLRADAVIHVFPVKEICFAAKRAKIPVRVATAGRWYTWLSCNKLLHIPRKNSNLHEAQLNLALLKGLRVRRTITLEQIPDLYGMKGGQADLQTDTDPVQTGRALSPEGRDRFRVILHPKSKGSAREWGLDNFSELIGLMPPEKFEVIITGTKEEGALMADFMEEHRGRITDMTGKLTLSELIDLIASADALVAASTGPLHIAAALGIRAVGLYAPMRPIFPQRWAPLGPKATFLVLDKSCEKCRKTMDCECIRAIRATDVLSRLS